MLAVIISLMREKLFGSKVPWEDCLPFKYQAAAKYSMIAEQSDAEVDAIIAQVSGGLK